ncbi:hypothetical protein D9M69_513060 [compost metagenome]
MPQAREPAVGGRRRRGAGRALAGRAILAGIGLGAFEHALAGQQRQCVDLVDGFVQLDRGPGQVGVGHGLHARDVAGDGTAQQVVLRLVGACQARVGALQRGQRDLHAAGQLQLLAGVGQQLLDLGDFPVVAVAHQVLVDLLQRRLLVAGLADLVFERADLGLQFLDGVLRIARQHARLLHQRIVALLAPGQFAGQVVHALLQPPEAAGGGDHQHGHQRPQRRGLARGAIAAG